jgi:hypothetical protein
MIFGPVRRERCTVPVCVLQTRKGKRWKRRKASRKPKGTLREPTPVTQADTDIPVFHAEFHKRRTPNALQMVPVPPFSGQGY